MLEVASPEDIRNLPDIQSWLDWMQYVEDELLHRSTREIRQRVLGAVLAVMAEHQLTIGETDFSNAKVGIKKTTLPGDFDLYGGRRDFYIPTIAFKNIEEQMKLFMELGAWLNTSMTLQIPAKRYRDSSAGVVSQFVPASIRPVSTLLAAKSWIGKMVQVNTGFAIDPLVLKRGEDTGPLLSKWVGLLQFARTRGDEVYLIQELVHDRRAYSMLVHPNREEMNEKPDDLPDEFTKLLGHETPKFDVKAASERQEQANERLEAEAASFRASPLGQALGYTETRSRIVLTDDLITPIYNFLKKLVEKLGYGQALSLLMRSPSLNALVKELNSKNPEINFGESAYQDIDRVRKVISKANF